MIGSQCESLNLLSFLPDAAREVAATLRDPQVGGCLPALGDGRDLIIDPSRDELDSAVTEAMRSASEDQATLFIALVGHGDYANDDFYFLTREATSPPSSRNSFLLAQRIKELLGEYSLVDGLVVLLDTCHAGIAAEQAAASWVKIVGQAGKRFEVLTASDERTAANGCFSRSLVQLLRSGRPEFGERVRCADLKRAISPLCPTQTAVHLAFDGVRQVPAGDRGLWLAANVAEPWARWCGTSAASEIDRLTSRYKPDDSLRQVVSKLLTGTRCVTVIGAENSGKSTLVAALARPAVADEIVPPKLMHAVLFLHPGQPLQHVADDLSAQLERCVEGFGSALREYAQQAEPGADALDRAIIGPLRLLGRGSRSPVRIAIDGLDDLAVPDRDRFTKSLGELTVRATLQWIRLVVVSRRGLPFGEVVQLPDPIWARTAQASGALDVPLPQVVVDRPRPESAPTSQPVPMAPPRRSPAPTRPRQPVRALAGPPPGRPRRGRLRDRFPQVPRLAVKIFAVMVGIAAIGFLLAAFFSVPWWVHLSLVVLATGVSLLLEITGRRKNRYRREVRFDQLENLMQGENLMQASRALTVGDLNRILVSFDSPTLMRQVSPGPDSWEIVRSLLTVAQRRGPLPLTILVTASALRDGVRSVSEVRDILVRLGREMIRRNPGTDRETVRMRSRRGDPADHQEALIALAWAIAEEAPPGAGSSDALEYQYAQACEAGFLFDAGLYEQAMRSVGDRPFTVAAENRARWSSWSDRLERSPDVPPSLALLARHREATWTRQCGEPDEALRLLERAWKRARTLPGFTPSEISAEVLADLTHWRAEQPEVQEVQQGVPDVDLTELSWPDLPLIEPADLDLPFIEPADGESDLPDVNPTGPETTEETDPPAFGAIDL